MQSCICVCVCDMLGVYVRVYACTYARMYACVSACTHGMYVSPYIGSCSLVFADLKRCELFHFRVEWVASSGRVASSGHVDVA